MSLADFRFSALGATYLVMLFVPNLLWARLRKRDDEGEPKESALLLVLERLGQAGTTVAALAAPVTGAPGASRITCLIGSLLAIGLYELAWVRYFRSPRTTFDLYRPWGPIPLPLAILPVLGFALLALYELHVALLTCVTILGVGHIGIHWQHQKRWVA